MKIIRFLYLVFLIVGCNYNPNNSDYVPPSIIWSTSDEMPSFKDCDEFDLDSERKMCFESKILKSKINGLLEIVTRNMHMQFSYDIPLN